MSSLDSEPLPERAAASPSGTWAPALQSSLLSCVAGSLVGCAIVHAVDPFFKFAQLPELGLSPSPELLKKYHDATLAFWTSNYALDFGLLGLCIGSTIGLFSTRTRRAASSLAGSLGGSVGGIISGYILGIFTAYSIIRSEDQSLVHSATMHFAIWASMIACILFMIGYVQDGLVHSLNYVVIGIVIGIEQKQVVAHCLDSRLHALDDLGEERI